MPQVDIVTMIGVATGVIGLWAAFWKWVLEPGLAKKFVEKASCDKRHDDCVRREDARVEAIASVRQELHELRVHVEWIRNAIEKMG